jgi:hypothetical protein
MTCNQLVDRLNQEIQAGMSRLDVERILDNYQLRYTYHSREDLAPLGETPFEAWENEHVVGRIAATLTDPKWPSDGSMSLSLQVYFDDSARVNNRLIRCVRMSP